MKPIVASALLVAVVAVLGGAFPVQASAADPPADRVLVMYFHRTERCPTCRKMGSYAEEAVKSGFAEQLRNSTVGFYYVDFQDERNAALAKGYSVTGPALIVARVVDNQVAKAGNLQEIWTKVRDKEAFFKYVQGHVAAMLNWTPESAGAGQPRR